MSARDQVVALLRQRRYSERTVEAYAYWVGRLEEFYPGRALSELTAGELAGFFRRLDLSKRSIRLGVAAIAFFYREIVKDTSRLSEVPRHGYELARPNVPSQKEILTIVRDALHWPWS